jgi:hypothetical protein
MERSNFEDDKTAELYSILLSLKLAIKVNQKPWPILHILPNYIKAARNTILTKSNGFGK